MIPEEDQINVGESVSFSCLARKKLDWVWLLNDGPLAKNTDVILPADSLYSVLQVHNATYHHFGTYKCMGYSSDDRPIFVASGELVVIKGK